MSFALPEFLRFTPLHPAAALKLTLRHGQVFRRKLPVFLSIFVLVPIIMLYGLSKAFGLQTAQAAFMIPGFMVNAATAAAFAAATYGSFMRLTSPRQYESWLAATLSLSDLIMAEVLWGIARGLLIALGVAVAGCLITGSWPVAGILGALLPTALASAVATLVGIAIISAAKSFDDIALYEPVITAAFVFSGVFTATEIFPAVIQVAVKLLPLYHAIEVARPMFTGSIHLLPMLGHLLVLVVQVVLAGILAHHLFKRRLFD